MGQDDAWRGRPRRGGAAALDALSERRLRVVYQPIVELPTGKTFAYEALARTSSSPPVDPPSLFSSAIAARCCGELGRALREIAVEGCQGHALFLNIHPQELDERWLIRPDDPLFFHDRPVYLEVTEAVPLSHFKLCHSVLREIRSRGVRLAIDDLGAGFSNLKYIADLAPEIVKLDRGLVAGLHEHKRLFRLVTSLVRLCEDMGAGVVAEGIETSDELKAAVDAGVRFGQGYVFARPACPPPEPVSMEALVGESGGVLLEEV